MFERTRSLGLRILNRLFLRSTIHDTAVRVDALHDRMDHLLHCLTATPSDLAAQGGMSHQIADQGEQLADRLALAVIDLRRGLDRMAIEQDRKSDLVLKELAELRKALADSARNPKNIASGTPPTPVDQADAALPIPPTGARGADDGPPDAPDPTAPEPEPGKGQTGDQEERHMAPDRRSGDGHSPVHGSTGIEQNTSGQHEALTALGRVLSLRHPLPATDDERASPDFLLFLYERIRTVRPGHVVEFGSGDSTLVIAAALRDNGEGRLCSFEHDPDIAATARDSLSREDLGDRAHVEYAPLRPWTPRLAQDISESWNWYDLGRHAGDLTDVDVLVVNGPPGHEGRLARYPALPALIDTLTENALIVLDGTERVDERNTAERWRDRFGADLEFGTDSRKGMALLTLNAPRVVAEKPHQT